MLSLVGIPGAAFVMMSCKAPLPVPLLRPATGDGLLGADTTLRATGTHSSQESRLGPLLPKAGDSAAQGRLPYNGAGQKQVLSALGQSRPPHSTRGVWMLAHDGSTNTPTATATALALAMVLAFAPMGDAQAAVGDCYGVRSYDGLCYGVGNVGSIEVSKEHISSSAPTRWVQVEGQYLTAEEDVKALQARVATMEKQVRVPLLAALGSSWPLELLAALIRENFSVYIVSCFSAGFALASLALWVLRGVPR